MNRVTTTTFALATGLLVLGGTAASVESAFASGDSTHATSSVQRVDKSPSKGTIIIKNYGFSGPGTLAPGARVTVKNRDSVTHTVTANSGHAFSVRVRAHKTVTFTAPRKKGTYAFHCKIHPEMRGSLKIK